MTNHLLEIEDHAARHGVSRFQTQMEVVVLSLLNPDRDVAINQIQEARTTSLEYVDGLGSRALSTEEDTKATRVARAMLQYSFNRILVVVSNGDGDEFLGGEDDVPSNGEVN